MNISALCGGMITGTTGIISPPMTSNFTYPNNLLCHWKLTQRHWTSQHGTLKLSLDNLFLENGCHDYLAFVRGEDLASGQMLKRLCGTQLDQTPTVVLNPGKDYFINLDDKTST